MAISPLRKLFDFSCLASAPVHLTEGHLRGKHVPHARLGARFESTTRRFATHCPNHCAIRNPFDENEMHSVYNIITLC